MSDANPTTAAPPATDQTAKSVDDDNDDDDSTAEEPVFSAGLEADVNARFIWRGLAFSSGPTFAPSAWASAYGFTVTAWSSMMLNSELPHGYVSSFVPSLTYAYSWERLKVEPGVILYTSPQDSQTPQTAEAALGVSLKLVNAFRLVTNHNVDIQNHAGAYFGTFGAEYEKYTHPWTVKATLDLGWGTPKFNQVYFGEQIGALNVVEGGLSARYELSDIFYLVFHTEASTLLAPSLRRSVATPTLLNGGTSLGAEF